MCWPCLLGKVLLGAACGLLGVAVGVRVGLAWPDVSGAVKNQSAIAGLMVTLVLVLPFILSLDRTLAITMWTTGAGAVVSGAISLGTAVYVNS